jgi:hypothetical protein
MQAIINLELGRALTHFDSDTERLAAVMQNIRRFFTRATGEIRDVAYDGPDGKVATKTAVITFDFHSQKNIVLNALHQISRDFNQECVAVLFSDGEGRLVGPEADRWGGFKIADFKRPAMYELLKEAA